MDIKMLKERVCKAIDEHREEIMALGDSIFQEPELGYKEYKTAAKVKAFIDEKIGMPYESEIARTGIIAKMPGRDHKVNLAIMGELDAVVCPDHPHADPETGAAHSCGHFAQIAATFGAALGLKASGVIEELDGDIEFWGVPAEECVEIEWRNELRAKGEITFLGGKQEMIKLGCLDNVDLSLMIHSQPGSTCKTAGTSVGFVSKFVKYTGKEAHAGGAPHKGINALNAAQIGLMAIHANRETFRDEDTIRVHPIITKGGDLVNIVPSDVRIEAYVRGKTMASVLDASKKVNRSFEAGAMAAIVKKTRGYSSADVVSLCEKIKSELSDRGIVAVDRNLGNDAVVRASSNITISVIELALKTSNSSISQNSIIELAAFEKNYNYACANGGIIEFMKNLK